MSAFISARYEKIEALQPDLVLGFSDLQADIAAELVRRGLPVMVFNQRSVPEILQMVRILGALPLTPAGVGIVEVGLTGALVAFGASNTEAVAATLLYRALTVFPTLALGLLAAATWRTHHPGETIGSPSDP